MANINKINTDSDWGKEANKLNANFESINTHLKKHDLTGGVKMPLFATPQQASQYIGAPYVGQLVLIGNSLPAHVFRWSGSAWLDTKQMGGSPTANLADYPTNGDMADALAIRDEKLATLSNEKANIIDSVRNSIIVDKLPYHIGKYIKLNGELAAFTNGAYSDFFKVVPGEILLYTGRTWGEAAAIVFYAEDNTVISSINTDGKEVVNKRITTPNLAYKARASRVGDISTSYSGTLNVSIEGKSLKDGTDALTIATDNINKIDEHSNHINAIEQNLIFVDGTHYSLGQNRVKGEGMTEPYCVPYRLDGDDKEYILESVTFTNTTYDFSKGIQLKLCLFDTEISDGQVVKLTTKDVFDYNLTSDKLFVNIRFRGNQTWAVYCDSKIISKIAGFCQGVGAYSFQLQSGGGVPVKGKIYTQRLMAFKIDLSIVYSITSIDNISTIKEKVKELEYSQQTIKNAVAYNNSDSLVFEGSSLTETLFNPYGTGWIERLNDMVDIPLVNNGFGGKSRAYNITQIANNLPLKHGNGVKIGQFPITYIAWINSANNSPMGYIGYKQLKVAEYVTKIRSSKMIVGTEEPWDSGASEVCTSFGNCENIPYVCLTNIARKCYPSGGYSGLIGAGHRGWRGVSPYILYKDLLKDIPINRSIKMFRVRDKFKVSSIKDLSYDNNEERLYKFVGISSGVGHEQIGGRYIDFRSADNIDQNDNSFDIKSSATLKGTDVSEVANILAGNNISFDKYALIELILDVKSLSSFEFKVGCNVKPINIYLAKFGSISESNINAPYTSFEPITFTYADGSANINLNNDLNDVLLYDKVRIIIECSSTFQLNKPKCEYVGVKKDLMDKPYKQRENGKRIYEDTGFTGSNWTLNGGAVIKEFPKGTEQYTLYNGNKKIAWLPTNNSYISRELPIANVKKIAVRVVAQNYYKLMTTRFNGAEYDDFVENKNILLSEKEYDYGELLLSIGDTSLATINALCTKELLVMPGWSEMYAVFDIPTDVNKITIKLQRNNRLGLYTSKDTPIIIHDVSVENIC